MAVAKPKKIPKYHLDLAGEYRICSELHKRGVFCTLTYGARKSADIYAIDHDSGRALRIEVKTNQGSNFVTGISQKGLATALAAPDFWVLFLLRQLDDGDFDERFYVASHEELCAVQAAVNEEYAVGYRQRHDREPDFSRGVDNVKLAAVADFEDRWDKIVEAMNGGAPPRESP